MSRTESAFVAVIVAGLSVSIAHADYVGSYANDFSSGGGDHYGSSFVTTHNGHSDLQLVSDGQSGARGTWNTGAGHFATRTIKAFSADFNFSFNTNGAGGIGDGFSFLFGDMTDMGGNRWEGGEGGINAFANDGHGMSIGFDTYGSGSGGDDSGIYSRWGSSNVAWTQFGSEWWDYSREESYDAALTDANQGHVIIEWDITTGLKVLIDWGGDPIDGYYTAIDTEYFTWPGGYDTEGWTFGFAGRNGGIDNDILIDNLNIDYNYVPAPATLALLGTICMGTRRRRK